MVAVREGLELVVAHTAALHGPKIAYVVHVVQTLDVLQLAIVARVDRLLFSLPVDEDAVDGPRLLAVRAHAVRGQVAAARWLLLFAHDLTMLSGMCGKCGAREVSERTRIRIIRGWEFHPGSVSLILPPPPPVRRASLLACCVSRAATRVSPVRACARHAWYCTV